MQDLWVSRIQSSGTAVSIEDIGFYKFEVVLENSNGYSGVDFFYWDMNVVDFNSK